MTGQDLKNSILQLAIQGKLVPQDANDEPASVLLERIKAEKQKLIKEKKIKKEKPLPEITEEEKPFEIPESWEWVRLGEIFSMQAGKNIKADELNSEPNCSHQYACFGGNGIRGYIGKSNQSGKHCIIGRQGALCGNVNIANGIFYATEHAVVVDQYCNTDVDWAYYFLTACNLNQYATATAQPGLAVSNIIETLIPLPPLSEQHRIVAKIEELMPLVEEYDKAQKELDALNAKLPEALKKSILQEAIQGKLVPQDPNDEPASVLLQRIRKEKEQLVKDGKLKKKDLVTTPITDEEKPFEIPESWEWCRMGDALDVRDGTHDSPKYYSEGYPLVTSKNLKNGIIDYSSAQLIKEEDFIKINERSRVDNGDILYAMIGSIGNPVIVKKDRDFAIKNMALFKQVKNGMFMPFVYLYLVIAQYTMREYASGGVQSFVSLGYLRNYLIPLPPLAEQHRIVSKIEDLFAQIEPLAKALSTPM